MNPRNLAALSLAFLLLTGCVTPPYTVRHGAIDYKVSGRLVNASSGEPLVAIRFAISFFDLSTSGLRPEQLPLWTTTESGSFSADTYQWFAEHPRFLLGLIPVATYHPPPPTLTFAFKGEANLWTYETVPLDFDRMKYRESSHGRSIDMGVVSGAISEVSDGI